MSILAKIRRALRIGSRINGTSGNRVLFTDSSKTLAEDSDLTYDGTTLAVGSGGAALQPTFEFGTDTGFYQNAVGEVTFTSQGVARHRFTNGAFTGINQGSALADTGVTNTVPGLIPRQDDPDTGVGGNGSDSLSLIAGGVEATRITESGGVITQLIRSYLAVGDFSANYVEFGSTGDINFVGGSGLQFGEIYYHGAGTDTVLAQQDTWYQVLGFATNGLSNGAVTPDHTNDHITIGKAGKYRILFGICARSAAANTYQLMVKTNNGTEDKTNIMIHIVTSVAGQLEARCNSGFATLAANDTVELWVMRTDGGAVSKTITFEHVNMHVTQKGG